MGRFLVTGATSGVGNGLARALVERGHHVIVLARSEARGAVVVRSLGNASLLVADLCDFEALDGLQIPPLDGIAHVAGILAYGRDPVDGVDRVWQTNYYGPIRLVERVIPSLPDGGTVAIVSGEAHRHTRVDAPGRSHGLRAAREVATAKLEWTLRAAREHPRLVITSFCPGRVRSGLARGLPWWARPVARAFLASGRDPLDAGRELVGHLEGAYPTGTYTVAGVVRDPASHVRKG